MRIMPNAESRVADVPVLSQRTKRVDQPPFESEHRSGADVGDVPAARLPSDAMQMLTETCFNCKQCRLECPSNVDIPGLMMEARAQQVAAEGLSRGEWFLSRIDSFVGAASFAAPLANWEIGRAHV